VRRLLARPSPRSQFDAWLVEFTERTDPFLSWLGVVFALLVAAQLGLQTDRATGRVLGQAVQLVWVVFVADFAVKLWLAPHKLRFLRAHWLQLLGLLAPPLRLLSFLRLARLGRVLPVARVLASSYRPAPGVNPSPRRPAAGAKWPPTRPQA